MDGMAAGTGDTNGNKELHVENNSKMEIVVITTDSATKSAEELQNMPEWSFFDSKCKLFQFLGWKLKNTKNEKFPNIDNLPRS